jgi:RNA polymerase sigma-70 factor (ECF subfamily)
MQPDPDAAAAARNDETQPNPLTPRQGQIGTEIMAISAFAARTFPDEATPAIRLSTQDSQLVAACLSGSAAAERALFDAHAAALHRTALRVCGGDSDVADDVTQEAFVRAFSRLHNFRGESSLRTWLTAIVLSCASRVMSRGSWLRNKSIPITDQIASAEPIGDPELAARLENAVAQLSPKLQVVFVMHDMEEFTHVEISGALGIPVGTSKARLHTARNKLRAALAREYELWRK